MPETPAIKIDEQHGVTIVRIQVRDLDETHLARVRSAVAAAVEEEPFAPFVVDMAAVKFVPSLTLGALVQLAKDFRSRRQRLLFIRLQPTVRQLFALTQLDKLFELAEDEPAALRAIGVSEA
jgi:anti-anti-sigma factor